MGGEARGTAEDERFALPDETAQAHGETADAQSVCVCARTWGAVAPLAGGIHVVEQVRCGKARTKSRARMVGQVDDDGFCHRIGDRNGGSHFRFGMTGYQERLQCERTKPTNSSRLV